MAPAEATEPGAGRGRPGLGLPLLLAVAVLAVSVAFAAFLRAREQRSAADATQHALAGAVRAVGERGEQHLRVLERLAAYTHWDDEAREHALRETLDEYTVLTAVGWLDDGLAWTQCVSRPEGPPGRELVGPEVIRSRLMRSCTADGAVIVPVPGLQDRPLLLDFAPVTRRGHCMGAVLAVASVEETLHFLLEGLAPGYALSVRAGDREFRVRDQGPGGERFAREATAGVRGWTWTLQARPGPRVLAESLTPAPAAVLGAGAAYALLLAAALHLARTSRWHRRRIEVAGDLLERESGRRERAEQTANVAREELARIVENFPDHVWSATVTPEREFRLRYYSDTVERISGYAADRFRNDPALWMESIHPEERERIAQAYRDATEGRAERLALEYRFERADGEIRWLRDRVRATPWGENLRLDGVISDVTDMKRGEEERIELEARFQQAQKLESLGVLAGGIAHDFNNLLVGVLGNARLASDDLPQDSPVREHLVRIERAANRAADLCRQMLVYAGRGPFAVEPIDLREAIHAADELLAASASRRVTLRYDFDGPLPAVEGDAGQIRQLLVDLVTNASEAIGEHAGTIWITLRAAEYEAADLVWTTPQGPLEPGTYVVLRVSDDGGGMEEETRRRLFEPFFSTKFPGRGLGLAAVQGIVRRHRGAIRVESEAGVGTTVTVLLPAVAEARPAAAAATARAPAPAQPGSATVLVVDDERAVREVSGALLRRAGFHVLEATDGREALEVCDRRGDEIACALVDLTMPGLDGVETCRKLRERHPELPLILCSGYPEPAVVERLSDLGLASFLEKPYRREVLVARVREAIEARRATDEAPGPAGDA